MKKYILWIGGIDDHYETLTEAQEAKAIWEAKGYDDLVIEEVCVNEDGDEVIPLTHIEKCINEHFTKEEIESQRFIEFINSLTNDSEVTK